MTTTEQPGNSGELPTTEGPYTVEKQKSTHMEWWTVIGPGVGTQMMTEPQALRHCNELNFAYLAGRASESTARGMSEEELNDIANRLYPIGLHMMGEDETAQKMRRIAAVRGMKELIANAHPSKISVDQITELKKEVERLGELLKAAYPRNVNPNPLP